MILTVMMKSNWTEDVIKKTRTLQNVFRFKVNFKIFFLRQYLLLEYIFYIIFVKSGWNIKQLIRKKMRKMRNEKSTLLNHPSAKDQHHPNLKINPSILILKKILKRI